MTASHTSGGPATGSPATGSPVADIDHICEDISEDSGGRA